MQGYDHHTYLAWQRNIRLQAAFAAAEHEATKGSYVDDDPWESGQEERRAAQVARQRTRARRRQELQLRAGGFAVCDVTPQQPSILTEDWFTGFIPRDEAIPDADEDGDDVEKVKITDGWGKAIAYETIEHYVAPRRTRDAIACDEALVDDLHRFDAKPSVGLTERELAVLEQRKLVVEMKAEAKRHYFKRLPKHLPLEFRLAKAEEKAEADPQVQASRRHAEALQQRQLFRELCRAYGLNQPSREALKALARVGGVKKLTYAAVNQAVRDRGYNPVDLAVAEAVGGFFTAARAA